MRIVSWFAAGSVVVVRLFSWYRTTGGGIRRPFACVACFRNGAVGGDSGFEAGGLCFAFGMVTEDRFDGDEKRKMRNPMVMKAARTNVMGFVRRSERAMAMKEMCKGPLCCA